MSSKFVVLTTFDDGRIVVIGHDDGSLRAISSDTLMKFSLAGLESDAMKVEYLEIGERVPPIPISGADEAQTLAEYAFESTPHTIIAAYSRSTKIWVVGKRTPSPF